MHIVDILIIVTFLIATLYIGFSSSKKIKTFSDYAIGNRKFSDFAICCTVIATFIGGNSTIGNIGKFYDVGIVQLLAQIGELFNYIIIGALLVKISEIIMVVVHWGICFLKLMELTVSF